MTRTAKAANKDKKESCLYLTGRFSRGFLKFIEAWQGGFGYLIRVNNRPHEKDSAGHIVGNSKEEGSINDH